MSIVITKTGQEPGIRETMDYLERHYGIPAKDIRAVAVDTEVGRPIQITVTVYQQAEESGPYDVRCDGCSHRATHHFDETGSNRDTCVGAGGSCPCNLSRQLVEQIQKNKADAALASES